jgi:glycosyltransferase involved in cell wall biosynthesis
LLDPEDAPDRFGPPVIRMLSPVHTLIEGKVGRFRWLRTIASANFLISQLSLLLLLLRLVRRERIDLIRSEDPLYNGLLAWIVARLTGRPLVIGVWGNPGEIRRNSKRPLMPRLFRTVSAEEKVERFVLRRADLALAQNEDNRRFILSAGVPPDRAVVFRLGNALDPAHFMSPDKRPSGVEDLAEASAGRPVLLVISRLERIKLVDHAVRALSELHRRGRQATLLIAGDGPMLTELEQLAAELGVASQVKFLGNCSQDWFVQVIPRVDAVISPLTGRALAEAALGGAPVVAYDVDWHSELIVDGETGELVPYFDIMALADALERLLDDPSRARRMGCALRERTMRLLDPVAAREMQAATYDRLLRDHRTARHP